MKTLWLATIVLIVMCLVSSPAYCVDGSQCQSGVVVMFGNGVWHDEDAATSSSHLLQLRLESKVSGTELDGVIEYELSFNPSNGVLLDLLETFEQNVQTDWPSFWRYLAGLDRMPDYLQDILIEIAKSSDAYAIQTNPAVQKHIANYNNLLSEGNKVVLVAHSQGNLFANIAYPGIDPEYIDSFGIVSVANPDSYVADGGPHTTLYEDIIIGNIPFALPANINNFFGINWHDWSGHKFADSYMASGHQAEEKILTDTIDTINNLADKICPEYIVVSIGDGASVIVWDPVTQDYASIIGNDGTPVVFPCSVVELSEWLNAVEDVGSRLFSTSDRTGNMPTARLGWLEAPNFVCISSSPWVDSDRISDSVLATDINSMNDLTNNSNMSRATQISSRNDCGGRWSVMCQENMSCSIYQTKITEEYNYDALSFYSHWARNYDGFNVGTRIAEYGTKETIYNGLYSDELFNCAGEDAYSGTSTFQQYTRSWFSPFGELGAYAGRNIGVGKYYSSICDTNYDQTGYSLEDTTLSHLGIKDISSGSTEAVIWVLTLRPSFKERNCAFERASNMYVPYGCEDTMSWVESSEKREIFVHAYNRFTPDQVFLTNPLTGGRSSAFEMAITDAYSKAFIELGIAEDENPVMDILLRVVQ